MNDVQASGQWVVAVLFVVIAFSDFLDGYLSRRWRVESDFGKLLDPLADKLLVMSALVMLAGQRDLLSGESWIPSWLVVLILARELWVTGIRSFASAEGNQVLAAGSVGKAKSLLQMVGITLVILYDKELALGGSQIPMQFLGMNLLFFSVFLSYWSAISYTAHVFSAGRTTVKGR